MSETSALSRAPAVYTVAEAIDPAWLTLALAPLTGGAPVADVEVVEVIRTAHTKIRFRAAWVGGAAALCLKGPLETPRRGTAGKERQLMEADFYSELAPHLSVRLPSCVATVYDRPTGYATLIFRDLIEAGAHFCGALEPFTVDQVAATLEQYARLHAGAPLLERAPWVPRMVADLVAWNIVTPEKLQDLLHGPRGQRLKPATRDAGRLIAGMNALAELDASRPATLLHGDAHAGNIFRMPEGPGLTDFVTVQRGGWALDVAYFLNAALPVETAAAHEWGLLEHYLDTARRLGAPVPADPEAARAEYRTSAIYGFYMWSITTLIDPAITETFVDRLGNAVERLDSFRGVGLG